MSDSGPTPIPAGDGTDGVAAGSVDPDRRFRALMGASAAIIWTAGPGGAATAPQPSWEAYTGQSWPEYAGDGWSAMVHPDDLSRVHRAWADALRTGARVYRTSFRVWHAPSGQYRHVSARSTALRDGHGRIVEWLGTFTDVQDVIAAEQAADRAATISEAMLASAPVGFGWVDTQLRFQYVNPALAAINRRTEAEHLGRTPAELLPLIGERVTELIRRTLAEGPVSGVEFSTPEPDAPGRFRHAVASYFPIRLADPAETIGVGFTVVDVTERTRLREALDAERVRYERLAATDVLAVFGGEGERITEANDAFLSMVGYTRADVAAGRLHWPDLTPPGFEEADERAIKELRTTGRAPAYAKEYRHRDGHPVPVLIGIVALHREPLRWLAYATDLTGERLAQAELRLFQALVERSGDAIAVARADGGMVYVNPAGRQLLGLPAEPGGGQRLTDLGAPEGLIAGALRDGYRRTETRLSRLDTGAEVEVEQQLFTVSTGPEADATGYLATVSRDIGERQRTLRRAEALARFAGELSRAQGPEEILRAMAGQVGPVFAARDVRIAVAEPGRPALRVLRFVERAGGGLRNEQVDFDADLPLATAIRQNRVLPLAGTGPSPAAAAPDVTVSDVTVSDPAAPEAAAADPATREAAAPAPLIHGICVPLHHSDGTALGAMRLDWAGPVRHDDVLDSLLTTVAGFASQALQRAELIRSTQATADLAARLSAARTVPETIDAILAAVPPVLGAVAPGLLLREGGRRVRLCHHGLPARLAEAYQGMTIDDPRPIAECLRTGQRIVLPDREAFRRRYPDLPDATESSGMVTTVALPLLDVRRRPIAALALGWSRARPFRATDLALLDTVADLCEQALERVRLAAAEHDLVSRLAGRLFDTAGAPPAGLDVAVRYRPAMTGLNLGGDWYDLIRLDGDRLAVVVGDVVGHEVEAAADMAQLRTVVRTLIRLGVPLGDVFSRVTELLGRAFLGTCLILLVDPGRRRVEMVRAGHPHPLWLRHGAPATAVATARALPFGLVDETIPVTELSVQPGDLLVAFTDGLVELRQHAYPDCVATLADVLAEASGGSADEVAAAVMDRLPAAEDDQALVVLRFPA